MRKLVIVFLTMALLGALSVIPVHAQVQLPHAFFGEVKINDNPAPDETEVRASVDTGSIIAVQNPVTTVGGSYGINSPRLLVQGDIPSGATITFHVTNENGTATGDETATFEPGGGPTRVDLSVTIAAPPSGGGAGGGAPTYYTETNLFGTEARFRISSDGEILATIEATSADGLLTMTIPKGTIALDKDGDRLSSLTTDVDPSPPAPPEDANIIGLAYDFGPDGATFDPAITFTWSYDPAALPEDVAEEDLVVAYYDEEAGDWVELDCVVDTENDTITASVEHFTTFAIIGTVTPPPEVVPPEEEVVPPEEEVAPPEEEEVAPPEEEEVAPPEEEELVPEVPAPINWLVLGGVIAAVIALGLLIFFVVRRRAA